MIKPHGNKELITFQEKYLKPSQTIKIPDFIKYDLEMFRIGAFTPLNGFLGKEDAEEVINNMHLKNGILWSIPILLPINEELDKIVGLQDSTGDIIAIVKIKDIFTLDMDNYTKNVYKTNNLDHPGVKKVFELGNKFAEAEILSIKKQKDILDTIEPLEMRKIINQKQWKTVIAFQTRNPIHRAHEYITKTALETMDGLVIHPLIGETKSDDIPAEARIECYEKLINNYYNKEKTILSYLPAAMRYAGPREAIHHMIIRKNYGFTHMIIGRDHAGVGDYYGTYEAQELVEKYKKELEIEPLKFEHAFYCKKCEEVVTAKTCPHKKEDWLHLSGTKVREMLSKGERPPKEFSRPEIADILIKHYHS